MSPQAAIGSPDACSALTCAELLHPFGGFLQDKGNSIGNWFVNDAVSGGKAYSEGRLLFAWASVSGLNRYAQVENTGCKWSIGKRGVSTMG